MNAWEAARNALQVVLEAKENEKIVVFCDEEKIETGKAFKRGAESLKLHVKLVVLKTTTDCRTEVPQLLIKYFTTHRPDIFLNIFRGSREETPFRIKIIRLETEDHKTRLGHCPGITLDMLTDGGLALTVKEHQKMQCFAEKLIEKLQDAHKIEITNPAGTKLSLSVKDRQFFTDTRLDWNIMKWMNLPTGEVIVAPEEDSLEGNLVCDLAVGGIGPLNTPIIMKVKEGKVDSITSENVEVLRRVEDALHVDEMAKVVGEFAFGINPKARFTEEFLEAEKMLGTVHVAFGDNVNMPGGENKSINHMDFLISKPTITVTYKNGASLKVMSDGLFVSL
ncbi:MAG: aminopeptidase [Candidatus Bathyarchaeota archaeon]|nr:aminopeptidase [Candidatus Bathyarchaeota archaeon]